MTTDDNHIKRARYDIQVTVYFFLEITRRFRERWLELSLEPSWLVSQKPTKLVKKSVTNQMYFIWNVVENLKIQVLIFAQSYQDEHFQLYRQVFYKFIR